MKTHGRCRSTKRWRSRATSIFITWRKRSDWNGWQTGPTGLVSVSRRGLDLVKRAVLCRRWSITNSTAASAAAMRSTRRLGRAVRASVLQLAMAYAALGNGKLYQPYIVERLETPSGEPVERFSPQLRSQLPILPSSLERLRRALVDVVADNKGTASTAFIDGLDIAGKSGTAQVRKTAEANRAAGTS